MKASVSINAKINLSLYVTGVEHGMHSLDMITASVGIADVIEVSPRSDKAITCKVNSPHPLPEIPFESNSAVRAARLLIEEYGLSGLDISITKGIPFSGGLGGSSADACGVIRAAGILFGIDLKCAKTLAIALKCGSDVPLQLYSGFKHVNGSSIDYKKLYDIPPYDLVIAKKSGVVNTRDSYALFDQSGTSKHRDGINQNFITALLCRDFKGIREYAHNDLFAPSSRLNPEIAQTITALQGTGAECTLMSGSGSACFGIYKDSASAQSAAASLDGFDFVKATTTVAEI